MAREFEHLTDEELRAELRAEAAADPWTVDWDIDHRGRRIADEREYRRVAREEVA